MRELLGAVALVLALSGCGAVLPNDPNAGSIDRISITTDENGEPYLDFPVGLTYSKAETRVVWQGDGEPLDPGDLILLDMYAVGLDDGIVYQDTYSFLPNAYLLAPELLGQDLYDLLNGKRVGARVLLVSPPVAGHEEEGPIAVLVDVLPTRADGVMQARRDELPTVVQAENGMPVISIDSSDKKFTELVAATLIEGDGPQVTADSWIRANFVAVDFDTGEIVQSSWVDGKGPAAVHLGVGEVPAGWDLGLVDQREGSEVLLVVPPNLAYGDATLVYVVDILAVWTPE